MAELQSTSTMAKQVSDALSFVQKNTVWIGIGRTTAWTEENSPPAPSLTAMSVEEVVGLTLPEAKKLAVPDNVNGTITILGQKWRILEPPYDDLEELVDLGARYAYVAGWLMYDQFPVVTFRQEAVLVGVQLAEGVPPGSDVLLPAQVASYGYPVVITNRIPYQRKVEQKEFIEFMIEWR